MKKTTLHKMVFLGIAVLFAGCAVLTVDVDVYKGPLANHEDIQTEQMAAMAIGAKPLLIELRDRLEAKYMKLVAEHKEDFEAEDCSSDWQIEYYKKWGYEDLETRLAKLRELTWYKREFVESAKPGYYRYFRDFNADSVNDILCLYKNHPSREQTKLYELYVEIRDKVYEIIARYVESYSILKPQDMREDEELAKKVREEAIEDVDVSSLLTSYKSFLFPEKGHYRGAIDVQTAMLKYLKVTSHQETPLRDLEKEYFPEELDKNAMANVTNKAYRLLAETKMVDVCADEIFGLKGELRDQFVTRVKQIARAYLDSRADLEDLWLATMDGIIRVNCQPVDPNESTDRDEFTAKMVDFSLEIIQPRYLAVLLDASKKKPISKDINNLAVSLGRYPSADPNISSQEWDFERMKYYLGKKMKGEPVETAKALKAIHEFCRSDLDPETVSITQSIKDRNDLSHLEYKEGWRFGLVRAPFGQVPESKSNVDNDSSKKAASPPIAELLTPGGLRQGFAATEPDQGGALAGGRLPEGLETFIEEYLERANVRDPSDDKFHNEKLRFARERLSDALVGFAEKLLFLANNRSLISPPKDQGLVMGTANVLRRSLLGEGRIIPLVPWRLPPLEDTINQDVQDVRILQAVGNSILVQADALHQERRHREQLKEHYDKEVAILSDTVSGISPVHRDSVDIKPIDKLLPENATGKDVRDVWIELLEYEHDLALYYGETKRAKEIADALDAARKKREDMIFIRPAMAYLRTSFPATSLQNNPNLTWDNMLAGHAMRSIPFGPQIGEFLNPDAKRDARINAEIDKQFWQNINRVRVAGGGFTNYAVVKDDIGNWYVKGYSANPNDVIKSAKNLAMFSLGAKMNTDLLAQINRKEGDLSGADDSDANRTGVEQLYEKYTDAYNARTQTDRDRLIDILKGGFKNDIEQAWHQNEGLEQLKDAISKLEEKRDAATKLHLNNALDELKKSTDDADHGTKIVGALRAIMWFHNTLLTSIHDLDLTAPAKAKLSLAEKNRAAQELNLRNARDKCSGLEKVKDKAEVDWNNKSQAAANDPENNEKKQISKEAKEVLDLAVAELVRAKEEVKKEQAALEDKIQAFETAHIEYEAAIRAEERAMRDVTRIVREELMRIITRRKEAVKDLETAIMFIGESNKQ